jgi:hypothetical protein
MRVQKFQEAEHEAVAEQGNRKKRKASDDEENLDVIRKRTKASNPSVPEGFFDPDQENAADAPVVKSTTSNSEATINIPSRPATPLKTPQVVPTRPNATVDEDEWAAFEAEIAAAEAQPKPLTMGNVEGVISAPAMTAAELKQRDAEQETNHRRERLEAEAEGDKEDAARKLEEEFEEMESLEARVRRLREKREALRNEIKVSLEKTPGAISTTANVSVADEEDDDDEDDDDDDDEWDGFRMKG